MIAFDVIRRRAERRKGGAKALAQRLPAAPSAATLRKRTDDRYLAEMARRVFCAGFAWRVVDAKWDGFEEAFLGFDPAALAFAPDEFWEGLTRDRRIVRNGAKILSVRANAAFVRAVAAEHGGFGRFLAAWPKDDQVGLLDVLAKRGSRLGGGTGQIFLRFVGWDGFMTTPDVVACLRDAGLDIPPRVTAKRDLLKVQAQFNAWAAATGLPVAHLSRICAMSIGDNNVPADVDTA